MSPLSATEPKVKTMIDTMISDEESEQLTLPMNTNIDEAASSVSALRGEIGEWGGNVATMGISNIEGAEGVCYHPAVVRWDEIWKGLGWRDMPGTESDVKKMNFALYRRGLLIPENAGWFTTNSESYERRKIRLQKARDKAGWKGAEA